MNAVSSRLKAIARKSEGDHEIETNFGRQRMIVQYVVWTLLPCSAGQRFIHGATVHRPPSAEEDRMREQLPNLWTRLMNRHNQSNLHRTTTLSTDMSWSTTKGTDKQHSGEQCSDDDVKKIEIELRSGWTGIHVQRRDPRKASPVRALHGPSRHCSTFCPPYLSRQALEESHELEGGAGVQP